MKKIASLLFLVMVLFASCGGNVDNEREGSHPYLEIVNESSHHKINSVLLLGYNLSPLNLEIGEAQTFALNNGMISGHENIYVIILIKDNPHRVYIKVNFENGKTTVITLKSSERLRPYLEVSYK